MMRAAAAWQHAALEWNAMSLAASQVVWRRTTMMARGTMSPVEAARMVMDKPAAFATGVERAAVAAARAKGHAAVGHAALKPVSARARANAKRLSGR